MMYLIKAEVKKRVDGISGDFTSIEGNLVNANNLPEAKFKFENHVRNLSKFMDCDSINFKYIELLEEIR